METFGELSGNNCKNCVYMLDMYKSLEIPQFSLASKTLLRITTSLKVYAN